MAIKCYLGAKSPTHEITLSDGVVTYGLRLADGPRSIQEVPMTPSTVHFSGGGTKFGDWEPGMSHIEQRTWEGGRALADFVDDPTRYFDSKQAWTLTPGRLFPAPAWKFANGHLDEINEYLPGDMDWRVLYGEDGYHIISTPFSNSVSWSTYAKVYVWVRRIGTPSGALRISIQNDDGAGEPDFSDVGYDDIAVTDIPENEMALVELDITGAALTSTTSHIVCSATSPDTAANHWEVGIDIDGGTGHQYVSTPSASWIDADFTIYHRITTAPSKRKWHFFEYQGALYAVDQKADGTASELYLNGDRGKATSGTVGVIRDTNFGCSGAWATNQWVGAYVKIVAGTGKGQSRRITSTNSVNGAMGITPVFDIAPDTTSEYVIYHTPIWTDISPSSGDLIDGAVKSVCVVDGVVYFAEGQSVNILRMQWNPSSSPPAHAFADDSTNKADLLFAMFNATNDNQVYAANTGEATLQRAAAVSWGTNLTLGTAFNVGENNQPIISLYAHEGNLFAFKPDGRYYIDTDDTAEKGLGDIGFTKSLNNGQAVLSQGLYSYFSWGGYALQRLYDSSGDYDLTNIGPDKGEGLPDDRKGPIVALLGSPPGIVAAVDGGDDNYSSILVMPVNGYGWHEVVRGWAAGKRIQSMYFQDSYRPRLWCDMGGELVYLDWPRHTFNPLKDSGITYMPEAHLISSTIDMGVSNLPKFIESLTASVENLTSGIEVQLDYQTNEDVGTGNWIWAGTFQVNPFDALELNQGEVYRIRFRLRLYTNDEDVPPVVNATVLEGYARTPVKYQWNMRLKISSTQRDMSGVGRDTDPDEFMLWLKDAAMSSKRIFMRSIWEQMDSRYVIVEPPTLLRTFTNKVLGFWGGDVSITVRDV